MSDFFESVGGAILSFFIWLALFITMSQPLHHFKD